MPMPRKPAHKQAPSETYAARVARGKIPTLVHLSQEASDALTTLAQGTTKSAVVERLVLEAIDR